MHTRIDPMWRWLLVLALVAGVIGMHQLIASASVALTDSGMTHPDQSAAMTGMGPGGVPDASVALEVHAGAVRVETVPVLGPASTGRGAVPGIVMSAGGSGPGAVMDMLMHACLAVLAGVIAGALVVAAVVLMAGHLARDRARTRPMVTDAARPPPRTAVRLALLCVLRN